MNPAQIENSNKSRRGKPNNSGREIPPPAQLVPKGILPIVAGAPRPKCVHAYIGRARRRPAILGHRYIGRPHARDRWRLIKSWLITIVRLRLGLMTACIGAAANSINADASGH